MSISVLIFLAVVFVLVYSLRMAKISALVAFLFAGILSGPHALNLFEINETWQFLGDIGILFLWFTIGLEINIRRLWNLRHTIFGFGAAQVMMVAIMLFPLLFGVTVWSVMGCVMVSLMLAMSSTSSAMDLLASRNQVNTNMGRQTFSILLFQDLLSIPLLAMLPVFAGKSFDLGASAIDVIVISVALIVSVVVIGRFVLNPLLKLVSKLKSKEAFLLAVMLNIVIWAVLLDLMGLPAGLGAFLAGMLMSETVYRHQIDAEIDPYATLFLALFFVVLGMGLNLPMLGEYWYIVLGGLIGLVAIKFIAIFMVARVRNVSIPDATMIALLLAQGGEFALLMLQTLKTSGIDAIPLTHQEILSAIIILSIMTTPILLALYDYLRRTGRLMVQRFPRTLDDADATIKPDVIICGFGRVGQIVAQMLESQHVPYVAIDLDVSSVMVGRERGFNVVYGNTTNASVLRDFGLAPRRVRAVVVALDNAGTARKTVAAIKTIAPRAKIFARARNLADSKVLLKDGCYAAMPETIESSFFLGRSVLNHLGASDVQIRRLLDNMRTNDYAELDPQISDKQ
ncbi:MAG: cation:proton antiporter [Alphaproteobacteria bacterium]|nr:cation:proton antiporter [Alphaproteobacteria bacterium]